jgi:hypothetical protein
MFHVESYTTPYVTLMILRWHTLQAQKEATSCTEVNVHSNRWTGSIHKSSTCDLIYLHRFLRRHLVIFKISTWAEVVTSPSRSVTATSELTSVLDATTLTRVVSELGWACQKVCSYGTFVSGLRQCHIYEVFEHLLRLWMGIWLHIHTITTTDVSPDLWELAEILPDASVQTMPLCFDWGCRIVLWRTKKPRGIYDTLLSVSKKIQHYGKTP